MCRDIHVTSLRWILLFLVVKRDARRETLQCTLTKRRRQKTKNALCEGGFKTSKNRVCSYNLPTPPVVLLYQLQWFICIVCCRPRTRYGGDFRTGIRIL